VAIRLRDEGHGDRVIAAALEIDEDQVPTLLRVADSKLVNAMELDLETPSPADRRGRPPANPALTTTDEGDTP
jgi:hypothetical protein